VQSRFDSKKAGPFYPFSYNWLRKAAILSLEMSHAVSKHVTMPSNLKNPWNPFDSKGFDNE